MRLASYQFKVVYRPGRHDTLADGLSRIPVDNSPEPALTPILHRYSLCPFWTYYSSKRRTLFCGPIIEILGNPAHQKFNTRIFFYLLKNSVLHRKVVRDGGPHLLLVVTYKIWETILTEAHVSLLGDHLGVARTYARIKDRYSYPESLENVARYVALCESCQHRMRQEPVLVDFCRHFECLAPFYESTWTIVGPSPQALNAIDTYCFRYVQ